MAKYNYMTFKDLFGWITYAYEDKYGCSIGKHSDGREYANFYKLTILSDGSCEYKGSYETYDPRLWPKVKQLVEMLQETKAEKVLYGEKATETDD